jgi:hypothetical protein
MKRVDNGSQIAGNLYTDGNPSTGVLGTIVDASCLNAMQEEIVNVVLDPASGITTLSQNNASLNQLNTAIKNIIDNRVQNFDGIMVKNTEASLGSDSTITATTATASGLAVSYTPISGANDRYLFGYIDWNVNDPDGSAAEGFLDLQYSTDNSNWTTIKTFTRKADLGAGAKEVKVTDQTLGTNASTTSTSYQVTGLNISYSPVNGSNVRYLELGIDTNVTDTDAGSSNQIALEFSTDNSSWSNLRTYTSNQGVGGATSSTQQVFISDSFRHTTVSATPYYRVTHRANPSTGAGASTVYTGSTLRVRELAEQFVTDNRSPVSFLIKHNNNNATPYYRIAHRVTSGDQSIIYTGSVLRVMEFS